MSGTFPSAYFLLQLFQSDGEKGEMNGSSTPTTAMASITETVESYSQGWEVGGPRTDGEAPGAGVDA